MNFELALSAGALVAIGALLTMIVYTRAHKHGIDKIMANFGFNVAGNEALFEGEAAEPLPEPDLPEEPQRDPSAMLGSAKAPATSPTGRKVRSDKGQPRNYPATRKSPTPKKRKAVQRKLADGTRIPLGLKLNTREGKHWLAVHAARVRAGKKAAATRLRKQAKAAQKIAEAVATVPGVTKVTVTATPRSKFSPEARKRISDAVKARHQRDRAAKAAAAAPTHTLHNLAELGPALGLVKKRKPLSPAAAAQRVESLKKARAAKARKAWLAANPDLARTAT